MILLTSSILIILIASFVDGVVEGFEFDGRKYFELKYNVDPYGYWGSKSWEKAKNNPNLYNKINGVWDFYHNCDDIRKYFYLTGAFLFAISVKWILLSVIITLALSSLAKRLGMDLIRTKNITNLKI